MTSSAQYLIQDPHHEYAVRFIEQIHRNYGHRAICFYTDRRERLRQQARFPQLRSNAVAAAYVVEPERLDSFGELVRAQHDVIAVIPFSPGVRTCIAWARITPSPSRR